LFVDGLYVGTFEGFAVVREGAALFGKVEGFILFIGTKEDFEESVGDLAGEGATVGDCTTFVRDTVGSALRAGAFFVGSNVGAILDDLAGALVGLVVEIAVGAVVGFLFPLFIEIALSSLSINI
jgi:hypothetical protein